MFADTGSHVHFTGTKRPSQNLFQHDNAITRKERCIKTWLAKVGEKIEGPVQRDFLLFVVNICNVNYPLWHYPSTTLN